MVCLFFPPGVSGNGLHLELLIVFICSCRLPVRKSKREIEKYPKAYVFRILLSVFPSLVSLICMELGIVGM